MGLRVLLVSSNLKPVKCPHPAVQPLTLCPGTAMPGFPHAAELQQSIQSVAAAAAASTLADCEHPTAWGVLCPSDPIPGMHVLPPQWGEPEPPAGPPTCSVCGSVKTPSGVWQHIKSCQGPNDEQLSAANSTVRACTQQLAKVAKGTKDHGPPAGQPIEAHTVAHPPTGHNDFWRRAYRNKAFMVVGSLQALDWEGTAGRLPQPRIGKCLRLAAPCTGPRGWGQQLARAQPQVSPWLPPRWASISGGNWWATVEVAPAIELATVPQAEPG